MTKRRSDRANSLDVARLAGVSIAAVSRAFTPGSSISDELAEKVRRAARQLNYVPNSLASSLITRQTNIVALMLPRMSNPIYAAMLAEVSRRLEELNKQVLLFTPSDESDFDRSLGRMLEYQVDAIVIAAATISNRMAALCLDRNVPVVMLGRHVPGLPVHSVRPNARDGGTRAAELLLRGGGRRFGIVAGPSSLTTMVERQRAVVDRLQAAPDASVVAIVDGGLTYEGGYEAALAIMDRADRPDSVVCMTDIMALGAMDAIRHRLSLRIPDDVAIIGFDDIAEAAHASYSLTTVKTPLVEMVGHMIDLIAMPETDAAPRIVEIDAELVVRRSTRAAHPAAQ